MQKINVVHSSTAQYKEDYLEKYGCEPNGDFIKDNDIKDIAAEEDCPPAPDCELSGSKCCEENKPPVLSCVDGRDCVLPGEDCCEDSSIPKESPCVQDEEKCETFGEGCCEGEKAEEEQVFGDRKRNSGLLMAVAFCIESPKVYVTSNQKIIAEKN